MTSSSGKMSLPLDACNGTAADFSSVEDELYDYQMHTRMCKKIAQLTKVIYSLNTKNEEQEATLQMLLHVTTDTADNFQPSTSQDEEGEESTSALRSRLLELQAVVEEVEEREQRAEADHAEHVAVLTREAADLRRNYHSLEMERDNQSKLLQQIQEEKNCLEEECQHLRQVRDENRKREEDAKRREEEERKKEGEEQRRDLEERKKVEKEWEERLLTMRSTLKTLEEEKERLEEQWGIEKEEWKNRMEVIEKERREEKEAARKALQQSLDEHISQWQQREQENCKFQNSLLQQRLKKADAELEIQEERLIKCNRHSSKLQARIEDLEEQLENCHHRVAEAERITRKAEEELAVAKERLLLQENELQNKSEELLNQSSSQVRVSAEVEELRSQLSRLNIRNKELELQNSGRSNDHARMLKQHADALSSMRLELQRAHSEEIQRLHQEVEKERSNDKQELEEEKKRVQNMMEEEKVRLKEKLRKALEELICKHASELRQTQASLENERKQAEEYRKTAEEERRGLETEKEELHKQLQVSTLKIRKLEEVIQAMEKEREKVRRREEEREHEQEREREQEKEKETTRLEPLCKSECERLNEELKNTQLTIQQMQVEFALEKEQLQIEISTLQQERKVLQQSSHSVEERISLVSSDCRSHGVRTVYKACMGSHCRRLQFEKHFSDHVADLQKEREKEIRDINVHWQHRVEELQTQLDEKKVLFQRSKEERDKEDCSGNDEMKRMKLEIQKTIEMNSSLSAQLYATIQEKEKLIKKQQLQVVQEEDEGEEAVKDNELTDGKRDERGWHQRDQELLRVERLNHQHALQALEKHASEELQAERQHLHTQYKLQLEKQKAELTQQHTEWVRQVTQRHMQQIEDLQNELKTHTEMMALQQDLKQQNRLQSLERQLDERSSEVQELKRENEELRERVHELNTERETSMHHKQKSSRRLSSSWKEKGDEGGSRDGEEDRNDEAQGEIETTKNEERIEIKTIILKEREETGKRRVEDLHIIAKLQDKLSERDQLIKRLVEDLHQLSQHPPLISDGKVKSYHPRTQTGSLTPTMKKKILEDIPPSGSSIPSLSSVEGASPKSPQLSSRAILPSQTQTPISPHPEAKTSVRHTLSPTHDLLYQLQLNNTQHIRAPSETRVIEAGPDGQDPKRQEWFTKYFSF
ncbi:protein FAM184B isoform X2 [Ictalurus furcatus]|uniref:protein FAM184B isoform X2 n=1 Tax=Ictalurus furcatus TaxID=66913 RepID=UPI0023504CF8|nr:protein FAM184B isoform X2 [Ictalurus furcatus]